jgi:hypothetical protein
LTGNAQSQIDEQVKYKKNKYQPQKKEKKILFFFFLILLD